MVPEEVIKSLSVKTGTRIVLLVLDGVGGLPVGGRTELDVAAHPNLDLLAAEGALGLTHPVSVGITPGSGPAHLGLFGYDPLKYEIGRGVLEALGVGLDMTASDVAARGNFATLGDNVIASRRASNRDGNRLATEKNVEIIDMLRREIPTVGGAEVILQAGEQHRFCVMLRREGLSGEIADADPQQDGLPPAPAKALNDESGETADLFNEFIGRATELLADQPLANTCLLRGFAKYPSIPSLGDLFKLSPAAIATYPMYRGLAQLVGMDILDAGKTLEDEIAALGQNFNDHDFFYVHVKKTDSYGEDGNFDEKVKVIEHVDELLPAILALEPDVVAVTGDHSTPASMKSHSWHPVPFLLWSPYVRLAQHRRFTEEECVGGVLGQFPAADAMTLMMANAMKLQKFGA